MIYTFNQGFNSATPPAIGAGSGIALYKSPKLSLSLIDKFGLAVNSSNQFSNQNSLYYDVDVKYPNGTFAPNGQNFETGLKNPSYTFTYEKNTGVFSGVPQRNYQLVFKIREISPASTSSGTFLVYHNEAQISGVSSVQDGTIVSGSPLKTGQIDINLTMSSNAYYRIKKFEIYSGDASNFAVVTGTGAGSNLLKTVSVFDQKSNYTLTINDGEQQSNNSYYFYKILPYDDFGSGVLYSSPPISGKMYSITNPAFRVDTITGKGTVFINSGAYSIQSYHSGQITTTGYTVVDSVLNVSGNIISGGWYNSSAVGDFDQSDTQYFKTIEYLAQTIDATGNVSSRKILITDNSTSQTGVSRTGIVYSEYAVSDSNQSAQFLVSGSGYSNGVGTILLMSKINYPTGYYKLLRTIL